MIDDPVRRPTDTGTVDAGNPWPGLAAFREADQLFFQGREVVVDELTRMVLRARLTVLHGVSGLGKTSVLRAGLFPRLRDEHVLPIYVRLGHSEDTPAPVEQVRDAMARAAQAAQVEAPRSIDDQTLWEYFHRRDAQFWDARNRIVTPLLVFDQFEELFTLGRATAERRARTEAFIAELSDLVEGRPAAHVRSRLEQDPEEALRYSMSDQPCKVLLSLREDFLPDLAELRRSIPAITDTMYRLLPMTTAEAMRVVEIGGGGLVDHAVAERIVRFVASARSDTGGDGAESVVEPALLSVFCRELNNKRRALGNETITADLLEGSRTAIISDFYERTISEGGLSQAIRMFVEERLLTESGFRDSVAEEQALRTPGITPADIDTLIARRLLRREDAGARERSRLELTHDVLAEAVRASRDRRRLREQQERAIVEQRAREERLRLEADEAAARERQQREFEAAERLAYTERGARKRLSILLVVIATLAAAAMFAAKLARDARTEANRALAASYVDRATPGEPWALPLLAQAVRLDPDSAMARALLVGHLARQVIQLAEMAHGGPVETAVFNSTGTRVLSTSRSGTARLWDPRTGQQIGAPLEKEGRITASAFSPDGARVVTGSEDGTARIWTASSGEVSGAPLQHGGAVRIATFDRSGNRVMTASDDRMVRVWHPESGQVIRIAAAATSIEWAEFDPTGALVLSLSFEGDAAVWDAASGEPVSRFGPAGGDAEAVRRASFGPDGSRILAHLMDGSARIIDTRTGRTVGRPLRESQPGSNDPGGIIDWARFDPSGSRILTTTITNADNQTSGVARLWDAGTGVMLPMNMSHADAIRTAAFSPDGSLVVTASDDGTARLWDTTTGLPLGRPLQHARAVAWAGFGADGRLVLTASDDGTAQLWDARTGAETSGALRHEGPVALAAFDADGSTIVTASGDRAYTWDARTGIVLETRLRSAEGQAATLAAVSPETAHVATVESAGATGADAGLGQPHVVRLWDSVTGASIGDPLRHEGAVNAIKFSPTGPPRLITAAADGVAQIWDAATAAPIGEPLRHRGPVSAAAFDADGSRVITASADGTARIWEASSGRPVIELSHCDGAQCPEVTSAAFNPDGTRVITGATDGNARLWNPWTGELIKILPLECATRSGGTSGEPITAVSFSPDGARILTSSFHTSLLRDVPRLEAIQPCLSHLSASNLPVFGSDTRREVPQIVTMSIVDGARLWDVRPEPVVRWEVPRQIAVLSAAFSGDGRLVTGSREKLVTGSLDKASRTWNVRTGKDAGLTLHRDTEPGWTAFSSDGSRLVTRLADGVVGIWDLPAGSPGDASSLADLAETVTGHALDSAGVRHLERSAALLELRDRAARRPPDESFADTLAQWLFADPATRTITPVSRITVPEYVARLRQEGESGEREARRLFPWLSPGRR